MLSCIQFHVTISDFTFTKITHMTYVCFYLILDMDHTYASPVSKVFSGTLIPSAVEPQQDQSKVSMFVVKCQTRVIWTTWTISISTYNRWGTLNITSSFSINRRCISQCYSRDLFSKYGLFQIKQYVSWLKKGHDENHDFLPVHQSLACIHNTVPAYITNILVWCVYIIPFYRVLLVTWRLFLFLQASF